MSFYFPVISSRFRKDEQERIVKAELNQMLVELENLVYWENIYNEELGLGLLGTSEEKPSQYKELLDMVCKILNKDKKGS